MKLVSFWGGQGNELGDGPAHETGHARFVVVRPTWCRQKHGWVGDVPAPSRGRHGLRLRGHRPARHVLPRAMLRPGSVPLERTEPGRRSHKLRRCRGRGVVVSGVVDPVNGVDLAGLAGLDVTLCRLRADPGELHQRLHSRRGSSARVEDVIAEATALDGWRRADAFVDTTGLTVEQTVQGVLQASGWASASELREPVIGPRGWPPSSAGGRVVWLCGPSGVGKSTIGFALYRRLLQAGLTAGYVDADQVGFCAVAPDDHWLKASNLAAVWENYRSAGAEALVVAGPVHDADVASAYETVLPRASFAWFRLHAGPSELARRVQDRASKVAAGLNPATLCGEPHQTSSTRQ